MTSAERTHGAATAHDSTSTAAHRTRRSVSAVLLRTAVGKLDPRVQRRNPVMFTVWCAAALTTMVAIAEPFVGGAQPFGGTVPPPGFSWTLALLFWLTTLVANIAESAAEVRGEVQVSELRSMAARQSTMTRRVTVYDAVGDAGARRAQISAIGSAALRIGDVVVLEEGDIVPSDGEVVWGIATVDESAITGESAPVIRESGGDRSAVTGGTRILSDRIVVRVTALHGSTAVDRMIALASGARRNKAPNEMALLALLMSFSLAFILVALTLGAIAAPGAGGVSIPVLAMLVVTLLPAEIAALMPVTSIAGLSRLLRHNVMIASTQPLESAAEITTVLLDKTGTVTQGNRHATEFVPALGVDTRVLVASAMTASLGDPTPEGTSTVALAATHGATPAADADGPDSPNRGRTVLFSAQTRMSGRDIADGTRLRKGAESEILAWLARDGARLPREVVDDLKRKTAAIARTGGTPLVVAVEPPTGAGRVLGVIHFKDVVKAGVPERIEQLRAHGIRTVMVTGDNPLTAAAIAAEAGVDDYLGDASPSDKLALIRREQAAGQFVAMTGDGTNDAPALAQANVGVAMHSSTAAAKEAANMIVLDDDPTKLVEIIETGRQQMATRGALTTFNIANDLIRYLALYPALFVGAFPALSALNVMRLHSPASAIVSTVVFGVLVIGVLIPLALAGVPYRTTDLGSSLNRNVLLYGLGGLIVAAVGIKLIDLVVALVPGY